MVFSNEKKSLYFLTILNMALVNFRGFCFYVCYRLHAKLVNPTLTKPKNEVHSFIKVRFLSSAVENNIVRNLL